MHQDTAAFSLPFLPTVAYAEVDDGNLRPEGARRWNSRNLGPAFKPISECELRSSVTEDNELGRDGRDHRRRNVAAPYFRKGFGEQDWIEGKEGSLVSSTNLLADTDATYIYCCPQLAPDEQVAVGRFSLTFYG